MSCHDKRQLIITADSQNCIRQQWTARIGLKVLIYWSVVILVLIFGFQWSRCGNYWVNGRPTQILVLQTRVI